jgi:3-deoxy-D-manno-octulosonic-acid transferase
MIYPAYRAVSSALEILSGPSRSPEIPGDEPVSGIIHGASAGEVKAASALKRTLLGRDPKCRWLVSTGTVAGLSSGADFRLPRDLPRRTANVFDSTGAKSLLLVEAELWPNLLAEAARRGVPVGVAGARISDASYRRLRMFPSATRLLIKGVRAFAAASRNDADRLLSLGAPSSRVEVCGWLKWPEGRDDLPREELFGAFHVAESRPLLVLGSVYPGEPTALARLLKGSALACASAHWLLVPRHGRHGEELQREVALLGPKDAFSVESRFGVLRCWYQHADAAFVGGGLSGRGCHDLLEALAEGLRPMCFQGAGDPGGVATVLAEQGLAILLDDGIPQRASRIAEQALLPTQGAYEELKTRRDGRSDTARFLCSQGVLS